MQSGSDFTPSHDTMAAHLSLPSQAHGEAMGGARKSISQHSQPPPGSDAVPERMPRIFAACRFAKRLSAPSSFAMRRMAGIIPLCSLGCSPGARRTSPTAKRFSASAEPPQLGMETLKQKPCCPVLPAPHWAALLQPPAAHTVPPCRLWLRPFLGASLPWPKGKALSFSPLFHLF
ncbi:hypothetical protein CIB84_016635 [Bambusicola thoracicus]|uniref:Uncharacterized protein n=1 Tax=Bambusicola thoracicus TaxID=9083 RepID=A0A2P4S6A3_BAMTH|nr:hypothetical protein CIB84_016635 [Bambusicola thoracicus]